MPAGTRDVVLSLPGQDPGDFATIRNLTLNGGASQVAVPPGTYGGLAANDNTTFILGIANAAEPSVYNLQSLTLNGSAALNWWVR